MAWSCADDTCLLPHDHAGKCVPYRDIAELPDLDFLKKLEEPPMSHAPKAPPFVSEEGPAA